jgi:hypothetical protein
MINNLKINKFAVKISIFLVKTLKTNDTSALSRKSNTIPNQNSNPSWEKRKPLPWQNMLIIIQRILFNFTSLRLELILELPTACLSTRMHQSVVHVYLELIVCPPLA